MKQKIFLTELAIVWHMTEFVDLQNDMCVCIVYVCVCIVVHSQN